LASHQLLSLSNLILQKIF